MARLQDFQTVTPTSSDKLLVVQSQGQGLVSYDAKLDTESPTGTGTLSINRKASTTIGNYSVALCYNNTASGTGAVATGSGTVASGAYSHCEGYQTTASNDEAHAEGSGTTASGQYGSHAEGLRTTASGNEAHAEGNGTIASGLASHAEGISNIANHKSQHVFGEYNVADDSSAAETARGNYIEIVGKGTDDNSRSNARTLDWSGNEVLAGSLTFANEIKGTGSLSLNRKDNTTIGTKSVAVGNNATASGTCSFAEGNNTTASGAYTHCEGYNTTASNDEAHAEGSGTTASGQYGSHAEGLNTTASGSYSHAEGNRTTASGSASHAEGYYTVANHAYQHAFGSYNVADDSSAAVTARGNYIEVVGKGTSDTARSNARTLDWSGNETIAGTLTQSSDAKLKDVIDEELPDVSEIKAVKFKWKKDADRDDFEHIGYLAQDVEKVLPYLVKEDAEGNKVLDYIAFLVAKIDSLERRLAELEAENE